MNVATRLLLLDEEVSVYSFTIDTTKTVSGATDGSQLNNQFILPLDAPSNAGNNFIIKVNDGRADVAYNGSNPALRILNFSTPGIYQITLIGRSSGFKPFGKPDLLKWISLESWGSDFKGAYSNYFDGATNLVLNSSNVIKLTGSAANFLRNSKGVSPMFDISKIDVSEVTSLGGFFTGVSQPLYSSLNPFMNLATDIGSIYRNANMSNVPKVEIIAPLATTANYLLGSSGFQGILIIKAPLTSIFGLMDGISNPPSLGQVDIRYLTNAGGFISSVMSTTNVDATLLGWVNNFDWSSIPTVTNKVTFPFVNSKYSNSSAVISARSFLISKGIVLANLTMA